MKKSLLHRPFLNLSLLSLFLATEIIWTLYLYRVEEKDFGKQIGQAIQSAIEEEIYSVKKKEPPYYLDLTQKNSMIMEYTLKGKYFRVDTIRKVVVGLMDRMLYDFYRDSWNLDSMAEHFRHFSPWPELSITFTRQDTDGKIIERYPTGQKIPDHSPRIPPQQLGNIFTDSLSAWFHLPLACFWERQKYGLSLSLIPLLLSFYYGILIVKKQSLERRNNSLLEKQTVFIHDLKTPLCTNRDIEKRILKNLSNWETDKVLQKLRIAGRQSTELLSEMEKLALSSACEWGGKIDNRTFNLKEAVEKLIAAHRDANEGLQFDLVFTMEEAEILGDPFHLLHIIDNLISNAVKYAGRSVHIIVACTWDKQGRLLISVKDNGRGIPYHLQKNIYKTGFRINPRSDNHGIGLAYIRKIVHQYKGYFHVSSKENEGTIFSLALNLDTPLQSKRFSLSPTIYYYFFLSILLAGIIWLANLYSAERNAFRNREGTLLEEAVISHSKDAFKWREDTTCFKNNWAEKTITIFRNQKDTTLPMGSLTNQGYVYGHMFYDLRDSGWSLDSIATIYCKISSNRYRTIYLRKDLSGKTIDHLPVNAPAIFMPVIFKMPLGFVEGHQLEVQLAYPWMSSFRHNQGWLAIALASVLLAGWFSNLLYKLTKRQQAIEHLQREKVQHFIRELYPQLEQILISEKNILEQGKIYPGGQLSDCLQNNIRNYECILEKINELLDRIVWMQIH